MVPYLAEQHIPGFGIMAIIYLVPGVGIDHVQYKSFLLDFGCHARGRNAGTVHAGKAYGICKGLNRGFRQIGGLQDFF